MNDTLKFLLEGYDTLEDWDRIVNTLSSGEIVQLEKQADMLAQQAARLSGYLAKRRSTDGDRGHDNAMRYADIQETLVRRVLGYTD